MKLDEAVKTYTINAEYERIHGNLRGYLDFSQLAEWLKELKRLKEQTRWIPVSERLPKEFESVIVCYKSQGGIAQAVSERLTNMDGSNRWSALAGVTPIAWMSLPEPYKEEREEQNE